MSKWPGFDLHAELIADVERRFCQAEGHGVVSALARQFGISRQGIHAIRARITYAHVSDLPVRPDDPPDLTRKEETA